MNNLSSKILKKIDLKLALKEYSFILIGTFLMAVGFVIFIAPLKLAPGGVYGIAIIIHHLYDFPIGAIGISLDIPLLIIGTLWLGSRFGFKTIIGIISLAAFTSSLEFLYGYEPLITLPNSNLPDPSATFILALCGAVLLGAGLGLIFKSRATSGGTDIIAMILGKYLKHVRLGTLLIVVDSIIVLGTIPAFNDWTIPLYSWLVIYVTGIVVDKVIAGFSGCKAVFIISDQYEEIKQTIFKELGRGGTFLKGEGMYNRTEKKVIFISLSRKQLPQLIHLVYQIDDKAFLSIFNDSETLGEGFTSLREKALH
ncbi:MAG TPA: YitT family protein [Bacteroidales bacterium]|nr:YitT family protein [Bacteroidales bacterium]HXK73962.1 YitT family protein [Bacteroidales bacterium]